MDPERIFADEYVPREQASTTHKKWEQANPNGDAPKWRAFRDKVLAYKKGSSPVAIPNMATPHGDALIAAGKLHMSVTDLGAVWIPPDPPSESQLRFTPPGYPSFSGYTTITITNDGSNSYQNLNDSTDYIIDIDDYVAPSGITIIGGRNVVIRGGRITTTGVGLAMYDMLGLVLWPRNGAKHYIEGLRIRPSPTHNGGSELHDSIVIRHNATYPSNNNSRIVLQNIRAGANSVRIGSSDSIGHPDCIQWQSDYPGQVWMDKVTFLSDYTGFMQSDWVCGLTDMHRVNFRTVDVNPSYTTHLWLYKGTTSNLFQLDDVWAPPSGEGVTMQGSFFPQPNAMQGVDAGWTGHNISGLWRNGNPPGGDFCEEGDCGTAYVPPGYV